MKRQCIGIDWFFFFKRGRSLFRHTGRLPSQDQLPIGLRGQNLEPRHRTTAVTVCLLDLEDYLVVVLGTSSLTPVKANPIDTPNTEAHHQGIVVGDLVTESRADCLNTSEIHPIRRENRGPYVPLLVNDVIISPTCCADGRQPGMRLLELGRFVDDQAQAGEGFADDIRCC